MDASPKIEPFDLALAHKHSTRHRAEIKASKVCGCVYCLRTYPPGEIGEWTDEGQTAICPKCPVDAVLGSASGYPITREFLERMYARWFC